MEWGEPRALLWLWCIPAACAFVGLSARRNRQRLSRFAATESLDRLLVSAARGWDWRPWLAIAGMTIAIVAMARPRFGEALETVEQNGLDMFVALDVSRSMLAEDVAPNRLAKAKLDIEDVLARMEGDRAGLIAFAGNAVVRVPLTSDFEFFRETLRSLGPKDIAVGGTAIGDAIRKAIESFEERVGRDRVLLLITDGEDQDSFPREAAKAAAEKKIAIFAVGLGDPNEGARVPIAEGRQKYLEHQGKEVLSKMDGKLLGDLAAITGGQYVPARTKAYDLGQVLAENFAGLNRSNLQSETRKVKQERFQWFLAASVGCFLLSGLPRRSRALAALVLAALLPNATTAGPAVEAYVDRASYLPGESIAFHVSSSHAEYRIEIARLGADRRVVHERLERSGKPYSIPNDASANGCGWPVAFTFQIPADWKSGYYSVRLWTNDDRKAGSDTFFIVRGPSAAASAKRAPILLQLATNTYNAYCNWGGYSLYSYNGKDKVQGRRVSFNRPVASLFAQWELPFVAWAERAGYAIDYAANVDLELHPELLERRKLVLSVGHDEYWSAPMRDRLEAYIGNGGNVAFFAGNVCCWQVRTEEGGRALTCWKQNFGDDPIYRTADRRLLSTLWSHHLVGRPENRLTGVGFLFGGYRKSHGQFMNDRAEYTVHRPDHWLLAGTNLARGAVFGDKDTIVGYECDGCDMTWREGLPYPTLRDGTPENFVIVATCPVRWHPDDCEWYERWVKGRLGAAVLGTYQRNGTVVTVGSTDWSHGLRGGDPAVDRITRNVLDRLSMN